MLHFFSKCLRSRLSDFEIGKIIGISSYDKILMVKWN